MDHRLVPPFILNQMRQGKLSGSFHAVSLLVDISGFTSLATALMEYSTTGAEALAEVLGAIFEPLLGIINAHGGFIATFAGDAVIALFPLEATLDAAHTAQTYRRATAAAWQSSLFVTAHADQPTRFGRFSFAIKISLADGMVNWGIWQGADGEETPQASQHAAYFFVGEALEQCFAADAFAPAGGILLTEAVYACLPANLITAHPVAPYWQLTAFTDGGNDDLAKARPEPPVLDPTAQQLLSRFFPAWLLQRVMTGEFRQVVAVFINLSQIPMQQAGEEFAQIFFQLLAQYGGYLCSIGRIGNLDQAATIILFWGAPISYENNVSRALRFVLDLQQATTVPIRAGVTYQLAYAGLIGSAQRAEYTCYGINVALAARQMMNAAWGEIVLDEFTADQAQQEFHLTAYGWRQFKGFIEEHPTYLLGHQRVRVSEVTDHSPLIGRQAELRQLHTAAQPLFQGRFGGVVIIQGAAGIGKSRLLREFQRMLAPETAARKGVDATTGGRSLPAWLDCRTDEILRQPLNPFRYLLTHYFDQSSTHGVAHNQQQFAQKLDHLSSALSDPLLVAELARLRPVLAALIDLPWEDPFYQQLEPELRLENTLEALKTFIKAESCCHPLIIQIEDAQWLDKESTLFLEKLVHNIEPYPLLLLITARPPSVIDAPSATAPTEGSDDDILPTYRLRTVLRLQPLAKRDLRVLVSRWLEGEITPELLDLLDEQAKGNPLFIEQMVRYWQEQGFLQWGDQGWQLPRQEEFSDHTTPLSLAPDIRALLTARLDRLPLAVKAVVQTAAILGPEFPLPVLAAMLPEDEALADHIALAESAEIWHKVGAVTYRFHHGLLRDAAYAMQVRAQLQKLHALAAAAIRAHYPDLQPYYAALVHHYYHAADQAAERRYARLAGAFAAQQHLNHEAVRYFDRVLALTPPTALQEQYEIVVARETAHRLLGDSMAQFQDIQRQAALAQAAKQPQWAAEAALNQANYARLTGDYETALESVDRAATLATALGNLALLGQAHYTWGRVLRHQGAHAAAQRQLEQALDEARTARALLLEAHCLYEIGHLFYVQGFYPQASTYYNQAAAIYQRADHQRGQVNCLLMFGAICSGKGAFTEAEQLYQTALTIAHALGWRPGAISCLSNLGNIYFDVGQDAAANAYHFQALQLCQEIGDREGEAVSLDTLGLIAQRQGELALAERYYTTALAIQQQLGDQHGEAYTQTHLGQLLLAQKQVVQAKACFQIALQIRQKLGELSTALDSQAGLAFCEWQAGALPAAVQSAQRILAQLAAKGTDGIEFPVQVYLHCYHIMAAQAQHHPAARPAADAALEATYQLLQARAAQIADPDMRRAFLADIPSHLEVMSLWAKR